MGEVGERWKEIEGVDHKGANNAMASVTKASAEKAEAAMAVAIINCGTMEAVNGGGNDGGHCCRRRQSSLMGEMAAMAVFVDGNGKGGRRQGRMRAQG
jgi:hypothetical protein